MIFICQLYLNEAGGDITPILHKLFQKKKVEGTLPTSFYKANIKVKDSMKKENYINFPYEHRHTSSQQNISKSYP